MAKMLFVATSTNTNLTFHEKQINLYTWHTTLHTSLGILDMTLDDVKQLIMLASASKTLELKKSTASLTDGAKSLCGFLNAKGGQVIFGVTDQHALVGQIVTDKTKLDIANVLRKFEPSANIDVQVIPISDNHSIIVMSAQPDERSIPYTFDGRPYERGESSKDLMSQTRYHQLLLARNLKQPQWESLAAPSLTIDDLDEHQIMQTVTSGIRENHFHPSLANQSIETILTHFGFIQQGCLINAAAILFGKNTEHNYIQSVVRMARFKGKEKGDFIDNKQAFGNAFELLDAAESFIRRNTATSSVIPPGQMKRIDTPEYPVYAVREALINAICHRDYAFPGGAITLIIYDDRMEIINTGLLPEGITIPELKNSHASHPRNPHITKIFYRRGLIEEMGMGTQKIVRLCLEANMQEPEFFEQAGTFVVRLWSSKHHLQHSHRPTLPLRQQKIILALGKDRLNTKEILHKLDEPISERTLRRDLSLMKDQEIINSEGPAGWQRKWFLIE